jgi:Uma2 family endonuclease
MASSKAPDTFLPGKLGYEDFWSLPDDGNRYEIIDGKLYVTPAPAMRHQLVSTRLMRVLDQHVLSAHAGHVFHAPTAVILGPHRQVQPDLLFISRERVKLITSKEVVGAPDLAVEIVSPSSNKTDRVVKSSAYADSGISWYWIVDPDERTIEEYRIENGQYRLMRKWEEPDVFEPALFPGLTAPLEGLFDWSEFEGLGPA